MAHQPNYDKLLEPIADVTSSIESLLDGAFGKLMGDQREVLKRTYAAAWGLHTLLLDIVTNIGIENIAKRHYLPKKFDDYILPLIQDSQNLIDGLDGPLNDEQVVSVEFIRITGLLLRHYVDNLWLYSQLSNDLYHLEKQRCTLETILDPMLWSVTVNDVELELLIPENAPLVKVDATLMQKAIAEIIENAINHTEFGNIKVSVSIIDPTILITISDTGSGIPTQDHPDLFTAFFQVDPDQLGLGLGLCIARKALILHNGSLSIQSRDNGTTVLVEFSA